jgi:hypothetical protein
LFVTLGFLECWISLDGLGPTGSINQANDNPPELISEKRPILCRPPISVEPDRNCAKVGGVMIHLFPAIGGGTWGVRRFSVVPYSVSHVLYPVSHIPYPISHIPCSIPRLSFVWHFPHFGHLRAFPCISCDLSHTFIQLNIPVQDSLPKVDISIYCAATIPHTFVACRLEQTTGR